MNATITKPTIVDTKDQQTLAGVIIRGDSEPKDERPLNIQISDSNGWASLPLARSGVVI